MSTQKYLKSPTKVFNAQPSISLNNNAFSILNKQGNGTIKIEELGYLLFQLGLNPSRSELEDVFHEIDHDENGVILLEDFTQFLSRQIRDIDEEQEWVEAFNIFDKEGKGFINSQQISEALKLIGEKFSEEEVLNIINQFGSDRNGQLN